MTDALPVACRAAGDGRLRGGATLKFFWGPMDCGKSTLALQTDYNHARQGRSGLLLTTIDRSGMPRVTTRIGLHRDAIEVTPELDLRELVRSRWAAGLAVDYLICDEASFYTVVQVEQMADLVDDCDVDVYAFGLATDFRSETFPAARRLFELADVVARLQVEVLCWCGRSGQLNARIVGGAVAREGAQVVIGDTVPVHDPATPPRPVHDPATPPRPVHDPATPPRPVHDPATPPRPVHDPATPPHPAATGVRYQVLCRRHYRLGQLAPGADQNP